MFCFACRHLLFLLCTVTGVVHSFAPSKVTFSTTTTASLHHNSQQQRSKALHSGLFAVNDDATTAATDNPQGSSSIYLKDKLLPVLSYFHKDEKTLPCGLDCTSEERELVADMITDLLTLQDEEDPSVDANNLVKYKNGKLEAADVLGTWDLLYTSSRIMRSNKSLSGLGHTSSAMAQFAGLEQKLTGSKFLGFIEYIEKFRSAESLSSSFDVTIAGEWMLEYQYTDPFTGEPTTAMRVEPEKVMYGPTTNQGDMWASLGPIKLLNIVYLTDDLQIARGNANPDSIFVFQKRQ